MSPCTVQAIDSAEKCKGSPTEAFFGSSTIEMNISPIKRKHQLKQESTKKPTLRTSS